MSEESEREKIAAIDADSICYLCSKDTIEESIINVDSIIKDIMDKTGCTSHYLFLSEGKYFRHGINVLYKANRPPTSLKYIRTLKAYLKEKYNAKSYKQIEADDMVMLVKLNGETIDTVKSNVTICSPDKDVLKQIEGNHYNYRTKEFVRTSEVDATKFLWIQALMGDAGDNIKGIPGIGEVKATKIIEDSKQTSFDELSTVVLFEYVKYYGGASGVYQFQKNFRLVYMMRHAVDYLNESMQLPNYGDPTPFIINNESEW